MDQRSTPPAETAPVSIFARPWIWLLLSGLIAVVLVPRMLRPAAAPPPMLGQLPTFELVNTDGEPFGSAQLAGRVYVANFIFTRCRTICPVLTRRMADLQTRFRTGPLQSIHLVSVSVDPEYDTPQRLTAYAADQGADPARWTFLTGDAEQIRQLVVGGFKTAMGDAESAPDQSIEIAHTGKFVLVDGAGRIRGYHDGTTEGLAELVRQAGLLLRERR